MEFRIGDKEVNKESVVVSEMGFGQSLPADKLWVHEFDLEISMEDFMDRMQYMYAEFVDEAISELEFEGESDPAFLAELGFPPLKTMINGHPQEFKTLLLEYLYGAFSETCFASTANTPDFEYVVNSFTDVIVNKNSIVVAGVLFERRA
jgi:hypothetical protein